MILHLSDIIVVSSDSISMISESINAGKYTVVFRLKCSSITKSSKHELFVKKLVKEGYIYELALDNVANILDQIWLKRPEKMLLEDHRLVFEKLKKLI